MAFSPVSGRYRGCSDGLEIELRVDLDGERPMGVISADYYDVSGPSQEYRRSMRMDAPSVTADARRVTIVGAATFSGLAGRHRARVTIPKLASGNAPATLQHLGSDGSRTLSCACEFESAFFREVKLDQACEHGVETPGAFDTTTLRSRARPRELSTIDAYADAGVDLVPTGPPVTIANAEAGDDAAWSDGELQAAMERHFSLLGDGPRWAIWLLHAIEHTDPELSGLMFDRRGPQRQGCAVFYGKEPAATDFLRRARLYNCVHELGHGFNLTHCWQRANFVPPIPSRPRALTWMNYPELYQGGSEHFFADFAFQFDDYEVTHLRHGFRQEVIMGGDPFEGDAARRIAGDRDRDPALRLRLDAPAVLMLNDPVTVGLGLTSTALRGVVTPRSLDPRTGTIEIWIQRPDGATVRFEPLLLHCRRSSPVTVGRGRPPVEDLALIHYGKQGFAFAEVGSYRLRALYTGPAGQVTESDVVTVRIDPPVTRDDRRVSELIDGDDQVGTLLAVMGSRAPALARGNEKLEEIVASHPSHPVAAVARLVLGTSLARGFKTVAADGSVETIPADVDRAIELIDPVIDLAAVMRAPATVGGEDAKRRAFADALMRVGVRRGVSPLATAFLNTMRNEIATVRVPLTNSMLARVGTTGRSGGGTTEEPVRTPARVIRRPEPVRPEPIKPDPRTEDGDPCDEDRRTDPYGETDRAQQPDPPPETDFGE